MEERSQFFQSIFFDAGDVGATDIKAGGNLALRQLRFIKDAVSVADDLIFFWRKNALYRRKEMKNVLLCGIIFDDVYRWAFDDIKQTNLVSFFVRPDRFIQRDFSGTFFA